jgi:hypothetical protein
VTRLTVKSGNNGPSEGRCWVIPPKISGVQK